MPSSQLAPARGPLRWGMRLAPLPSTPASRVDRLWRWPVVLALVATIPAFYAELLSPEPALLPALAYGVAAAMVALARLHTSLRSGRPAGHLTTNLLDVLLVFGLIVAALAPASLVSPGALVLRLGVALVTLLRMVWALQHLLTRGSLPYLVLVALGVLLLCGVGFWWLEPTTPTLADGLWLAFTTAATVGYGDVVPTTPASRIFAVFVVVLGFGVLTMATAAIATVWIGTEERRIERQILHDVHAQLHHLHAEMAALRTETRAASRLLAESRERERSTARGGATASAADPRRSAHRPSRSEGQ
jgi:voltage-gated potassium channel